MSAANLAPMDLPFSIGSTIAGKYRIDKVLGAGGMGFVFAGMHVALGQKVAIKILKPSAYNPEYVARFEREARAAARLRSEHVARVLDVGEIDGGLPYMVMEYLRGKDLAQILKEGGPLALPEAADYIVQACEGLAEAHRRGIVHRDLKPANLFITKGSDGEPLVKVLDFGISKMMDRPNEVSSTKDLTESQTVIGSPHYMSPEQLKSAKDVDARTDIWSLGSVLYKLLTGEPAFEAESQAELCVAILVGEPRPLRQIRPDVPEPLVQIVLKCMRKKPADRWQSTSELANALAPFAPPRSQSSIERISRMISIPDTNVGSEPPPGAPISGPMAIQTPMIPIDVGTIMTTSMSQDAPFGTDPSFKLPVTPVRKAWIAGAIGGAAFLALLVGVAVTARRSNAGLHAPQPTVTATADTIAKTSPTATMTPAPPTTVTSALPTPATQTTDIELGDSPPTAAVKVPGTAGMTSPRRSPSAATRPAWTPAPNTGAPALKPPPPPPGGGVPDFGGRK